MSSVSARTTATNFDASSRGAFRVHLLRGPELGCKLGVDQGRGIAAEEQVSDGENNSADSAADRNGRRPTDARPARCRFPVVLARALLY